MLPVAEADLPVDVSVRFGCVPSELHGVKKRGAAFDAAEGQVLFRVPNVGQFLVQHGREVVIERQPGISDSEIRVFVMNTVFAALLRQRGLLALSASAVRVNDSAVLLLGGSATGKSTLAAQFRQQGIPVLADDICPIVIRPGLGPVLLPGFPVIRLWQDAANHFGFDIAELSRPRACLPRYEVPNKLPCDDHWPVAGMYLLTDNCSNQPETITSLSAPGEKLPTLLRLTKGRVTTCETEERRQHLKICAALAGMVPVFQLHRHGGHATLSATARLLRLHMESHCRSSGKSQQRVAA
ncbi:MAG: hypothetical protein KDA89_22135 [Planctomycetaceae bacterium]|nr:hypothetical protein [Planctomycetaceae bacterium]